MPTLNEWFDTLMHHEWSRVRIGTRDRRLIDYRRLRDTLGSKRLDKLTVPVIHAWLHALIDQDGNRRCVQAAHDTLCAMLAVAVEQRLLPENTAKLARYPADQMQRREQTALSHDEYRRLLDACRDVSERSLIRVLCEAGLRRSEAAALQVGDLDLDAGLIHIQRRHYQCRDGTTDIDTPKSHQTRWAAINPSLVAELREVIAGRENAADTPVWTRCNRYTDNQLAAHNGTSLYKALTRLGRHTGLAVWRVLRRYPRGSSLARRGGVVSCDAALRRRIGAFSGSTLDPDRSEWAWSAQPSPTPS